MPALRWGLKAFNICLNFELGFEKPKIGRFSAVSKTGRKLKGLVLDGVRLLLGLLASHENRTAHSARRHLRVPTKHNGYHLAEIQLARTRYQRSDRFAQGAMAQLQRQGLRLRPADRSKSVRIPYQGARSAVKQ
jgi:hypothetical protein